MDNAQIKETTQESKEQIADEGEILDQEKVNEKWEELMTTETFEKQVRVDTQQTADPEAEKEEDKEFNYKSNLKLRPEHIDQQLNKDLAMKKLDFSQHEYVKINEVGLLINEAVQGVVDKIHSHDKITQANKTQVRVLETKFKQMEQQVIGLLKLNKAVNDMYKKVKDVEQQLQTN